MHVYYTSYVPRLPTRSTRLCDIVRTWVSSNASFAASVLHRMPVQFGSPLEGNQRTSLHIRHQTTSLATTFYMACFHCIAKTTGPQLYLPQLGDTDCPRSQEITLLHRRRPCSSVAKTSLRDFLQNRDCSHTDTAYEKCVLPRKILVLRLSASLLATHASLTGYLKNWK